MSAVALRPPLAPAVVDLVMRVQDAGALTESTLDRLVKDEKVSTIFRAAVAFLQGYWVSEAAPTFFLLMLNAAKKGHALAQGNLSAAYHQGIGVQSSIERAFFWAMKGVEKGNRLARYNLFQLMRSTNQECAEALFAIAQHYIEGEFGFERSEERAFYYMREAAKRGHIQAAYEVGSMYFEGRGVTLSQKKSHHWLLRAAKKGYAPAQFGVSIAFKEGIAVEPSLEKAFHWALKAAKQGDLYAEYAVSVMYATGSGVAQSREQALFWNSKVRAKLPEEDQARIPEGAFVTLQMV